MTLVGTLCFGLIGCACVGGGINEIVQSYPYNADKETCKLIAYTGSECKYSCGCTGDDGADGCRTCYGTYYTYTAIAPEKCGDVELYEFAWAR